MGKMQDFVNYNLFNPQIDPETVSLFHLYFTENKIHH